MAICKWCREEILEDHSMVDADWIHASGWYQCVGRWDPLRKAEPADERWDKVWASVTRKDDGETEPYYHFHVYVYYNKIHYARNAILTEKRMRPANVDLYSDILNIVIGEIDRKMTMDQEKSEVIETWQV